MPLDADYALMPRAVPQDASGCGRATSARRRATPEALLRHILRGPTATLALARWCAGRGIDDGLLLARVDRASLPASPPRSCSMQWAWWDRRGCGTGASR